MARRRTRTRKTRTRRTKRGFNLMNAAELYVTTNILTESMFAVNPLQFLTGRTSGFALNYGQGQPDYQNNVYRPIADGTATTLPELLGVDSNGTSIPFGGVRPLMPTIQTNLAAYGGLGKVAVNTIVVKAGFTIAKKLLSKQRRVLNEGIKAVGLKGSVSV